jgi:hypothetical protein
MAATPSIYPIHDAKDIFKALNALKPDFDISEHEELYVDFDTVRSKHKHTKLFKYLGIQDGQLSEEAGYAKILYTGHMGSGKSTELLKLHHTLNSPSKFFSIYVDIDDYIQISDFESEDFIIILIASLVNALQEHDDIDYAVSGIQKIADEWLSEKEVSEEIKNKVGSEGGVSAEAGVSLLRVFSAKAFLKGIFSYESATATTIRKKIEKRQGDYVAALNEALLEIKKNIRVAGKGNEILFIIDGLEKLRWGKMDTFAETFFQNNLLVRELSSSLICCVPIDSLYDGKMSPVLSWYSHFTLPLIAINDRTSLLFSEIVSKRISEATFFESGVLGYCVQQSGGSPRQLLTIVRMALYELEPGTARISIENAKKVCRELGTDLLRRLTTPKLEALREGNYQASDDLVLDMLFSLALMEYNGDINTRMPNPLLKLVLPFLQQNV